MQKTPAETRRTAVFIAPPPYFAAGDSGCRTSTFTAVTVSSPSPTSWMSGKNIATRSDGFAVKTYSFGCAASSNSGE